MRRIMLSLAAVLSIPLIVITALMWARSFRTMDWLRISALDRAAVLASSRAHVGAAFVISDDNWAQPKSPAHYQRLRPADLRRKFDRQFLGFAYDDDGDIRRVLLPMWALIAGALLPPMVWMKQKRPKPMRSNTYTYAPSLS